MAAIPSERRLAAILSGDIVGYSRLIADDEESTVAAIQEARELVEACATRHRGRLADFTGDNFLAEFRAARDAVECALELQREVEARTAAVPEKRQLRFRIGAHLGDVLSANGRLFGDGVNVAARLEPLALPGGLCLSGAVVDQVRGKLPLGYQDLGEQALKNIAAPVRAYRAFPEGAPAPARMPPARAPKLERARRLRFVFAAAALAALAAGAWQLGVSRAPARGTAPTTSQLASAIPSVAVLPFESLSADPDDAFLAPGLAAAVQHRLASRQGVTVIASSSSFALPESERDVREIGRRLGARYLVSGTLRRAGDRLRATTRLIDASTGGQVWSLSFDRTLADIFAVEDEISEKVAEAMALTAASADAAPSPARTRNLEAHLAYLQGKALFARYRLAESRQAAARFAEASRLDPEYAEALVGEADARLWAASFAREDEAKSWRAVKPLIERALALDPTLGEAYVLRAEQRKDEAEFRKGLALAPNYSPGFASFAEFLYFQLNRRDEALSLIDRARQLDPLRARNHYVKGLILFDTSLDEAEKLLIQALEVDPGFHAAFVRLSQLDAVRGRFARGVKWSERALAVEPTPWIRESAALLYLALDEPAAASEVLGDERVGTAVIFQALYEGEPAIAARLAAATPRHRQQQEPEPVVLALRDQALRSGELASALQMIDEIIPRGPPSGASPALDVDLARAHLLRELGRRQQAIDQLAMVLDWIEREGPRHPNPVGYDRERAIALALQRDRDGALAALEATFARPFRQLSWYALERNPAFAEIRPHPRFQALIAALRAHRVAQRAELEAMRARGEVPRRPVAAPAASLSARRETWKCG